MLNEKIVSTEELIEFFNQATLTPEQTKYLEEKVKNAYLNKDISIEKFSHTEQTIKEMLKYGRFDLISKIEKVIVSGPKRELIEKTNLDWHHAAPGGDVMMTGTVGLIKTALGR